MFDHSRSVKSYDGGSLLRVVATQAKHNIFTHGERRAPRSSHRARTRSNSMRTELRQEERRDDAITKLHRNVHRKVDHRAHVGSRASSSLDNARRREDTNRTRAMTPNVPSGVQGEAQIHKSIYDLSDAAYYKIFRTTLTKRALAWFNQLPAGTIAGFEQLPQRFLHQFSINRKYPKICDISFSISQRDGEPLRDYVMHFVEVVHEVTHVNHELLAGIMQQNLRHGRFKESIAKTRSTLEELLFMGEKYIRIEETFT
ncbi:LOW QUALITY PROTEIN: hypothetical protein DH2020_043677 [Rehmannia glutinosa]|uniref:Retrotransposon gag domain-containing protein n=1 Tax=Rehmannia glutinosa TaxID=99300 RepID=A0ABR0UIZ2_REHGL